MKAKKYLKQYSYREVANWLTRNTGRIYLTVGLKKRLDNERRRKNKAGSLRRWADYAKKAIAKAEEIDNKRLGAKAEASKEEQAQPKPDPVVDTSSIEEQHNVIFKPNAGPQTDLPSCR